MGAVAHTTHAHQEPSRSAPDPLSVGSPRPPRFASPVHAAPSPSRPSRPAVADRAPMTIPRRSWTPSRGAAAASGRSTVPRWVQAAGTAAGVVLKRRDQAAKTLVRVGCLDEIVFHRGPVLVGVELQSRVGFPGTKADDRKGSTGLAALPPGTALG